MIIILLPILFTLTTSTSSFQSLCTSSPPSCLLTCTHTYSNAPTTPQILTCNTTTYNLKCLLNCTLSHSPSLRSLLPINQEECPNCQDEVCVETICINGCNPGTWGENLCENTCGIGCDYETLNCDENTGECFVCLSGYYGTNCDQKCSSSCNGCNQTTGNCLKCQTGYWGPTCENKCNEGCSVTSYANCDVNTGECANCKNGYWGASCENKCSPNCYATSSYYQASCDKQTGKCEKCKSGYWKDDCSEQCGVGCSVSYYSNCEQKSGNCTTCKEGYWDAQCNSTCSTGCKNSKCNKETGDCAECAQGKTGKDCSKDCPPQCKVSYLVNCFINETCSACEDGFWGDTCETACPSGCKTSACNIFTGACTECNLGYYGDTCNEECSKGCNTTVKGCNQQTGECECNKGFYGSTCTEDCSYCNTTTSNCNSVTGTCVECNRGFYGSKCDTECPSTCNITSKGCDKSTGKCDECNAGYYGYDCSYKCPSECPNKCDRNTGECADCPDGTWGSKCENACGEGCDYTDSETGTCDPKTGECTCKLGYYNTTCNKQCGKGCNVTETNCGKTTGSCYNCLNGWFGSECHLECGDKCNTTVSSCNKYTGKCDNCIDGYWGTNCTSECPDRCKEKCDKTTGYCENCPSGFYGKDCDKECPDNCDLSSGNCAVVDGKCLKCKDGYYGSECKSTCSSNCKDSKCEQSSGNCIECAQGKYGSTCSSSCENCFFANDTDNCNSSGKCDKCKAGFYDGTYSYGADCSRSCSVNCDMEGCDKKNGSCVNCILGKYGSTCDSTCDYCKEGTGCDRVNGECAKCPIGKYGRRCNLICPDICGKRGCKIDSGECAECETGFWGEACDIDCRACGEMGCDGKGDCYGFKCNEGKYGEKCNRECECGDTYEEMFALYGSNESEGNETKRNHSCSKYSGNCLKCGFGVYGIHGCRQSCHYTCHTMTCCILNDKKTKKKIDKLTLNADSLLAIQYNDNEYLIKVDFNKGYPLTLFNTSGDIRIPISNNDNTSLIMSDIEYNFTNYTVIGDLYTLTYTPYMTTNKYNKGDELSKHSHTTSVLIANKVTPSPSESLNGIIGIGLMSTFSSSFVENNVIDHNIISYKYKHVYNDKNKQPHYGIHITYGTSFDNKFHNFIYCSIPINPSTDILGSSLCCNVNAIKISNHPHAYVFNNTIHFSLTEPSNIILSKNYLDLFNRTLFKNKCDFLQKPNITKVICDSELISTFPGIGFVFGKFVMYFEADRYFIKTMTEYGAKMEFVMQFTNNTEDEVMLLGYDVLRDTELMINNEEGELYIKTDPVRYYYGEVMKEYREEKGIGGKGMAIVVIGGVVGVDVLVCIWYFVWKRKKVNDSKYVKVY